MRPPDRQLSESRPSYVVLLSPDLRFQNADEDFQWFMSTAEWDAALPAGAASTSMCLCPYIYNFIF